MNFSPCTSSLPGLSLCTLHPPTSLHPLPPLCSPVGLHLFATHTHRPDQPPPDVPLEEPPAAKNTKGKGRPWFARDASHQSGYQAGGSASDPSVAGTAFTNDPEADAYGSGSGGGGGYGGNAYSYSSSSGGAGPSNGAYAYGGGGQGIEGGSGDEGRVNAWESRFGWRIDLMAAATYLGGPVTGKWNGGEGGASGLALALASAWRLCASVLTPHSSPVPHS